MKSYNDIGFIIRRKQLREADKLIILLGEKYGKIESVAKGAGKVLSRKGGNLDLLNLVKCSFHKTKGLDIMVEAELVDNYEDIKQNLSSISEIFYLLEIIDKFWIGEDDDSDFFTELRIFLDHYRKKNIDRDLLISAFEIKLLDFTGFTPLFDTCLMCADKLNPNEKRIAASSGEAGYLCQKHFNEIEMKNLLVPDTIIKVQKFIFNNSLDNLEQLNSNESINKRLRSIQKVWLEGILENRLKSANFLEHIKLIT